MSDRFPGVYASRGVFVCFEGGEGAGKSTQARLLQQRLEADGRVVLLTHEPGDTLVGKDIRRIVLDPATGHLADRTEALLYAADKAEHVEKVVLPGARARRGRDHRPLRRLDARLPGRRPRPRRRRPRAGRPVGHVRPAATPDRAARPRAQRRVHPLRGARPHRGRVPRLPPARPRGVPPAGQGRSRPLPGRRRPRRRRRDRRPGARPRRLPPRTAGHDRLGRPRRPGPGDRAAAACGGRPVDRRDDPRVAVHRPARAPVAPTPRSPSPPRSSASRAAAASATPATRSRSAPTPTSASPAPRSSRSASTRCASWSAPRRWPRSDAAGR